MISKAECATKSAFVRLVLEYEICLLSNDLEKNAVTRTVSRTTAAKVMTRAIPFSDLGFM